MAQHGDAAEAGPGGALRYLIGNPLNIIRNSGERRIGSEPDGPLRQWLTRLGTEAVYITPVNPWENGYCESFNGKLRDELLKG
jgi:hypothetical protein